MYFDMFMVAYGGALGALLRYIITMLVYGNKMPSFPYGTLIVNLLGCLCIGLVTGYFVENPSLPMYLKLFIVTGLLGGLTTFSTFSVETFNLFYQNPWYACLNIGVSIIAGLALIALGVQTAKTILA